MKLTRKEELTAKHLLTLSVYIDWVRDRSLGLPIEWFIFRQNDLLKELLKIGHFVPSVDGVPLKKLPKYTQLDDPDQTEKYHEWHEAKKHVILEDWEVSQNKDDDHLIYVENKALDIEIEFDTNDGYIEMLLDKNKTSFFAPLEIKTIADLAEATKENPIPLTNHPVQGE